MDILAWLIWNPDRIVFTIPGTNHPVVWYGVWFALGFIVGYLILVPMIQRRLLETRLGLDTKSARQLAAQYVDRMTGLIVIGTIVGARLGHVFFYEWPRYQHNPIEIFQVWKGGLASHGATLGILLALFLYVYFSRKKFPEITFLTLLDIIVVPTAFAACCIRIGNFFNQEILGIPSSVPWAIIFGDPADGGAIVPRHPVQLYEAIVYFVTFIFLYSLWKFKGSFLRPGMLSGLFFILVFGSRFFLEFLKVPQSAMIDESFLQTGQYLSIPVILAGVLLLLKSCKTKQNAFN